MRETVRVGPIEADGVRLITTSQLAEEFRVPVTVVYGWVRRDRLPYHRIDRRLLFVHDELRPLGAEPSGERATAEGVPIVSAGEGQCRGERVRWC